MTVGEAAELWGTNRRTIRCWIDRKKIPAMRIPFRGGSTIWQIPDGTPCPQKKEGVGGLVITPAAEQRTLRNMGKHGYVKKYAGILSLKHMAQFLQTNTDEVRAIYDDIVAGGGM